ncbi:MAG: hypothetical protein QM820_26075 [Minicystis sp.]
MSFSFLFLAPAVGSAAMPVTEPDPHYVLEDLRISLKALQESAARDPGNAQLLAAVGHLAAAVAVLEVAALRDGTSM